MSVGHVSEPCKGLNRSRGRLGDWLVAAGNNVLDGGGRFGFARGEISDVAFHRNSLTTCYYYYYYYNYKIAIVTNFKALKKFLVFNLANNSVYSVARARAHQQWQTDCGTKSTLSPPRLNFATRKLSLDVEPTTLAQRTWQTTRNTSSRNVRP